MARRHLRGLTVVAWAAALALSLVPGRADAAADLGVNVNRVVQDLPLGFRDPLLGLAGGNGIAHARSDAFWYWNQPSEPSRLDDLLGKRYQWGKTDLTADALARHGVRWQPVLGETPRWQWTGSTRYSPPKDNQAYAAWAHDFAARYGSQGTFWRGRTSYGVRRYELWNEPNHPYYWRPVNPARYADLYLAGRQGIHSADPAARVIFGGLAGGDPAEFLTAAVRARPALQQAIDVVGLHPYARTPLGVARRVRRFRSAFPGIGLRGRPVALTELGWWKSDRSKDPLALPDSTRAGSLALTTDALARSDCSVETIEPYTWSTPEQNPRKGGDWYGLVAPNGLLHAPAKTYIGSVQRDRAGGPVLPVCSGRWASRPLAFRLTLRRASRGCRAAVTSYYGWPVNGVPLFGRDSRGRQLRAVTDRWGRARLCGRGAVRARGELDGWGRTAWVRK